MADWDEHEHPRHPAKAPDSKGGEFRPKGAKAVRDLATLSRSTLLKYARDRGLTLPRGMDDDAIRGMIRRFDSGAEPEWIKKAGEKLAAKKAPAKKAPVKKTVDPETRQWLDDEKRYGPKYAAAARAMRQQGLKPEQIATRPEDLRAGMHVLVGDRFHRLVRPRSQPGKGWFTQGGNPQYLDSMPDAQLRSALLDYNRTMEAVQTKKAPPRKAGKEPSVTVGVAFNSRKHPEGTRVSWTTSDGETVYGTVGKMGRFTTIDWEGGKREKIRANVNHDDIRVVDSDQRAEETRKRLGIQDPAKKATAVAKAEAKVENLRGRLGMAEDRRKKKGERQRGAAELRLAKQLRDARIELDKAKQGAGGDWAEQVSSRLAGPAFIEPPAPRPTTDPQELYNQAVEFATLMNAMGDEGGGPRFHTRPSLKSLQGLLEGRDPREIWRQLEREAESHPVEWGGGREYLNRMANFLMRQVTTLPPEEAAIRRERRDRYRALFEASGGKEYWRTGTMNAGHAISDALGRLQAGEDPAEVVQFLRFSAQGLATRAARGEIQDYDMSGVLRHDPRSRQESARLDAKLLRRLADAIAGG